MQRLTIGVNYFYFLLREKKFSELSCGERKMLEAIEQQEIILSESLLAFYKKKTGLSESIESYLTAYGNVEGKYKMFSSDRKFIEPLEELLCFTQSVPLRILVSEKSDLAGYSTKKVNIVSPKKICDGKEELLSNYTFPLTKEIIKGKACSHIEEWLAPLFYGEEKIIIFDRYIMNNDGVKSLKKYFFPHFPLKAQIVIYCTTRANITPDDIRNALQDEDFSKRNVTIYECGNIKHDRYIELSRIRIRIGAGLGLLCDSGIVREDQECSISISRITEEQHFKAPSIIRTYTK